MQAARGRTNPENATMMDVTASAIMIMRKLLVGEMPGVSGAGWSAQALAGKQEGEHATEGPKEERGTNRQQVKQEKQTDLNSWRPRSGW